MSKLSFDQKKTLAAHERFFGNKYDAIFAENGNTNMHIETQKMCYLLKVSGVEIGDFSFSWNFRGPFSPGLLALLRSIDRKQSDVLEFYENNQEKGEILSGDSGTIDKLRTLLDIEGHHEQQTEWVEVLGSLTYISRVMLPGASFDKVHNRFVRVKPEYNDKEKNRYAWELLEKAKLVLTIH